MDSKSLSHTRWKCQYHIVFIPKYRKKQLYGRLREDVKSIIKSLCAYKNVEIDIRFVNSYKWAEPIFRILPISALYRSFWACH